jgi:hypothetical protein
MRLRRLLPTLALSLAMPAPAAIAADASGGEDAAAAAPVRVWTDYPPADPPATAEAADAAAATPAQVQAAIQDAMRADPGLWADYDLDHDGKVSQLEVVACVAKRPSWLRTRFPAWFARIDTDHDGAISFAELSAFAARADRALLQLSERPRTFAPYGAAGLGGGGGQAGAGVDIGSGGATASAAFMHQQAYIAGYEVVGGQYQPVIGVLGYGTVLTVGDVVITVVHDGR